MSRSHSSVLLDLRFLSSVGEVRAKEEECRKKISFSVFRVAEIPFFREKAFQLFLRSSRLLHLPLQLKGLTPDVVKHFSLEAHQFSFRGQKAVGQSNPLGFRGQLLSFPFLPEFERHNYI